jgi:Holliday junction resolvase RusA-like endonuclease
VAEVSFTVYGTPAPQGSKRAFVGKSGKAHVIESSHDRVKSWRQAVIDEALKVTSGMAAPVMYGGLGLDGPFTGALAVEMVFSLRRPKGHYRTGKNESFLRDSAPAHPITPPDASKLARSTEDALTDSGIWADDALITDLRAIKRYCPRLQAPGATITIREIWEQEP